MTHSTSGPDPGSANGQGSAASSTIDLREGTAGGARFERALVVDDDAGARQMVADGLALLGVQAVVAATPEEAVDAVAAYRPDILFIDHSMPGLTGADTAAAIRAALAAASRGADQVPELFVVAVTGEVDKARGQSRRSYDHYLEKPVRVAELAMTLERSRPAPLPPTR